MTVARVLPWLVAAAIVGWPAILGAALVDRIDGPGSLAGDLVYLTAAQVCHQQPARSFATRGHSWPVCARCSGLYLAAPLGAAIALLRPGRSRIRRGVLAGSVAGAAVPVAATWLAEAIGGVAVSGTMRAVTAVPAGMVVGLALVAQLRPAGAGNQVD